MSVKEIKNAKDIMHLDVVELFGLLAAMATEDECDVGMEVHNLSSEFKFYVSCERVQDTEEESIIDKIKRWFK